MAVSFVQNSNNLQTPNDLVMYLHNLGNAENYISKEQKKRFALPVQKYCNSYASSFTSDDIECIRDFRCSVTYAPYLDKAVKDDLEFSLLTVAQPAIGNTLLQVQAAEALIDITVFDSVSKLKLSPKNHATEMARNRFVMKKGGSLTREIVYKKYSEKFKSRLDKNAL